jgi:hypothetical protein
MSAGQLLLLSILGALLTLAGTVGAAWISYRGARRASAVTERIETGRLWREDVDTLRRQRLEDQAACEEAIAKYQKIVADLIAERRGRI